MDHITTRFGVFLNHYSKCRSRKQLITFETLEAYSNKFPCKIKENEKKEKNLTKQKMMMMMIIKWTA